MGNKNTSSPQSPDTGHTHREEGACHHNTTGNVSRDGPLGLSMELLASLQSLRENTDYTLLPQSLHQIAEAYSLQEDYQWAIQFLQLEKLYHERLLSNLAALQENWESRWREKNPENSGVPGETDTVSDKYIDILSQICRTHARPSISVEKDTKYLKLREIQMNQTLPCCHDEVINPETSYRDGKQEQNVNVNSEAEPSSLQMGGQEVYEEGQEVEEEEGPCAETPEEEEEVKVEWPSGVAQASDKELAKLSNTEGSSSPDGLVSILKRRRASLDGLPPSSNSDTKSSTRKVRFSEPEDGIEQDEVGGDSCLILLLLCLVTVVISIGGTALYCTLVDTYSNICTDFTQNVNFYAVNIQRFFEGLGHWLPLWT